MKKYLMLLISLLVIGVSLFGGCEKQTENSEYPYSSGDVVISGFHMSWCIIKSPITNRYYEMYHQDYDSYFICSEVTEAEYLKYLEMIEEK
jgi:hypothetical protein